MSQVTNNSALIVNAADLRLQGAVLGDKVTRTVIIDGAYFNGTEMVPMEWDWKVAPLDGLDGQMLNLTPHTIGVQDANGNIHRIPASGFAARAVEVDADVPAAFGCKIVKKQYGATEGLPPEGVPVLISTIAAAGAVGRINTFIPDSGKTATRNGGLIDYVTQLTAA